MEPEKGDQMKTHGFPVEMTSGKDENVEEKILLAEEEEEAAIEIETETGRGDQNETEQRDLREGGGVGVGIGNAVGAESAPGVVVKREKRREKEVEEVDLEIGNARGVGPEKEKGHAAVGPETGVDVADLAVGRTKRVEKERKIMTMFKSKRRSSIQDMNNLMNKMVTDTKAIQKITELNCVMVLCVCSFPITCWCIYVIG